MCVHLVLFALLTLNSHAQDKTPVEIETPHGTVAWKELSREKDGNIAQFLRAVGSQTNRTSSAPGSRR